MSQRPRRTHLALALSFALTTPAVAHAHGDHHEGHHDHDHDHDHDHARDRGHDHDHARNGERTPARGHDRAQGARRAEAAGAQQPQRGGGPAPGANPSSPAPAARPAGNGAEPEESQEARGDVNAQLVTASAAFRAARAEADGLAALYAAGPQVTAAMREHGEVLRRGLSHDLSTAREQLDHVRTLAEQRGRGDRVRPDLAAVDAALAQVDRDLAAFGEQEARGGAAGELQQRARDAAARLGDAQSALERVTAALR